MREIRDRKVRDEEGIGATPEVESPEARAVVANVVGAVNTVIPGLGTLLLKADAAVRDGIEKDAKANLEEILAHQADIARWERELGSDGQGPIQTDGEKAKTRKNWATFFAGESWQPK